MLVLDQPPVVPTAEPQGQPQPLLRVGAEVAVGSTSHEGVGKGDVVARDDLEGSDREARAAGLPGEEPRPGVAVGLQAADPAVGGDTSNITTSSL